MRLGPSNVLKTLHVQKSKGEPQSEYKKKKNPNSRFIRLQVGILS